MNKTAFIISIALTTFILLAVGGIVYMVRAADTAQTAATGQTGAIELTAATNNDAAAVADLQQALSDREAAYQQLIAEANTRLAQAQQDQLALQTQLAALQQSSQASTAQSMVTPEQAATIASDFLGQTSIYTIEPVTVQGVMLYQVTFSSGDVVYVSLDGQVVGSMAATQIASQNPGVSGSRGHEREHENEQDHDD